MRTIRPLNGWILARRLKPQSDAWSLEGIADGIYRPDGLASQRVTNARAEVIAVSGDYNRTFVWEEGNGWERETNSQQSDPTLRRKLVRIQMDPDIQPGAVIVYRGYLTHAINPFPLDDKDLFLINVDSVMGIEEVDLAAELSDECSPQDGLECLGAGEEEEEPVIFESTDPQDLLKEISAKVAR